MDNNLKLDYHNLISIPKEDCIIIEKIKVPIGDNVPLIRFKGRLET